MQPKRGLAVEADGHKYLLVKELGSGGQGSVWAALDEADGTPVAIKFREDFFRDVDAAAIVDELRQEAAHMSTLNGHGAPVPIAVGVLRGPGYLDTPFLVMTKVEGRPLLHTRGLRRDVELVADLLGVLEHLHRAGVVHRDVKPWNVLADVASNGAHEAFLVDYGIARRRDSLNDTPAGSRGYAPPEYLMEGECEADPSADVFGAGAVLHRLLSGNPPYPGDASNEQIPCPEPGFSRLEDIPPHVADVVARALACNPADRYPSAQAMRQDLERAIEEDLPAPKSAKRRSGRGRKRAR